MFSFTVGQSCSPRSALFLVCTRGKGLAARAVSLGCEEQRLVSTNWASSCCALCCGRRLLAVCWSPPHHLRPKTERSFLSINTAQDFHAQNGCKFTIKCSFLPGRRYTKCFLTNYTVYLCLCLYESVIKLLSVIFLLLDRSISS